MSRQWTSFRCTLLPQRLRLSTYQRFSVHLLPPRPPGAKKRVGFQRMYGELYDSIGKGEILNGGILLFRAMILWGKVTFCKTMVGKVRELDCGIEWSKIFQKCQGFGA